MLTTNTRYVNNGILVLRVNMTSRTTPNKDFARSSSISLLVINDMPYAALAYGSTFHVSCVVWTELIFLYQIRCDYYNNVYTGMYYILTESRIVKRKCRHETYLRLF